MSIMSLISIILAIIGILVGLLPFFIRPKEEPTPLSRRKILAAAIIVGFVLFISGTIGFLFNMQGDLSASQLPNQQSNVNIDGNNNNVAIYNGPDNKTVSLPSPNSEISNANVSSEDSSKHDNDLKDNSTMDSSSAHLPDGDRKQGVEQANTKANITNDSDINPVFPHYLKMHVHFQYEPVPEYSVTATNLDTGYFKPIGAGPSSNEYDYFECGFFAGAYLIKLSTATDVLDSFIYNTNIDGNCNSVLILEYTPLGGTGKSCIANYKIYVDNSDVTKEMFLYVENPPLYFNTVWKPEFMENSVDNMESIVNLVLDRSDDNLHKLFYGIMRGQTYYGKKTYFDEEGTLIIQMEEPLRYPG